MALNPDVRNALESPPNTLSGATQAELEGPSRLRRGLATGAQLGRNIALGALAGRTPAGFESLSRPVRQREEMNFERDQASKKLAVELLGGILENLPEDDPSRAQIEADFNQAVENAGVEGFSGAEAIRPAKVPGVEVPEALQGVIGPVGKTLTNRQEKIVGLFNRGVPPALAADFADNLVSVVTDPVTGESRIVNRRTGTGLEAEPVQEAPTQPVQTADRGIAESVEAASGPAAAISKGVSRVFGALVPGVNPRLTDEQRVNQFNQEVKFAFSRNPRFPVAEIERIQADLLPDVNRVFTDPEFEAQKVPLLRKFLIDNNEADTNILSRGGASRKGRAEARDRIATREAILELIGDVPDVDNDSRINELEAKGIENLTAEELDELEQLLR